MGIKQIYLYRVLPTLAKDKRSFDAAGLVPDRSSFLYGYDLTGTRPGLPYRRSLSATRSFDVETD